jgi:LysM repeat protein
MENNESNLKPQSTGGLKLMTVFIAVLALHVLVIGGVTVYHLMSGGSTDTDLTDAKGKDAKIASDGSVVMDSQAAEGSQPSDKTASTEGTTPAIEQTTPADTAGAPAPAPAPVATASTPTAATPTGPVVTPPPALAPTPITTAETTEPAAAPPLEPEAPAAPASGITYVVKMNDTIEKIAHKHHTTVTKLKSANGLNGEVLHVGERLIIPGKTAVAAIPASDLSTPTNLSGSPTMAPEEPAAPAPVSSSHHTYTVVKGDTLSKIAHKFHTTTKALIAANNITDPAKLSIGKKLVIPGHGAQTATMSKPTPVSTPVPAPAPAPAAIQPAPAKTAAQTTGQLANFVQ